MSHELRLHEAEGLGGLGFRRGVLICRFRASRCCIITHSAVLDVSAGIQPESGGEGGGGGGEGREHSTAAVISVTTYWASLSELRLASG